MSTLIYGVDTDKPIHADMVRDAISLCFFEAHCIDAGIEEENKEINKVYCREIVKKAFSDSGGDFDHPTKSSILHALEKLAEFSRNFRDPSVIQKHMDEIMVLVGKLN